MIDDCVITVAALTLIVFLLPFSCKLTSYAKAVSKERIISELEIIHEALRESLTCNSLVIVISPEPAQLANTTGFYFYVEKTADELIVKGG